MIFLIQNFEPKNSKFTQIPIPCIAGDAKKQKTVDMFLANMKMGRKQHVGFFDRFRFSRF